MAGHTNLGGILAIILILGPLKKLLSEPNLINFIQILSGLKLR